MNEVETQLKRAYRRGYYGLGIAAVVWTAAYFVARKQGWPEYSVVIPIAAAGLSVLCYIRYRQM